MNINPEAVRILCYGDSNTWGQVPVTAEIEASGNLIHRFPPGVRRTSLLQAELGDEFEVIEEGLSGRTTRLDQVDRPGRNVETYLVPCLDTHNPVDIFILFLGTNDLKEVFDQTASDVANSILKLTKIIKTRGWNGQRKMPKIVVVAPPLVNEEIPRTKVKFFGAGPKSRELTEKIKEVAETENFAFVNLADVAPSRSDGLHLEPEAHVEVSRRLVEKLNVIVY